MTDRVKVCRDTAIKLGISGAFFLACGLFTSYATAQVTGVCDNCHTMHNSQNANTEVKVGTAGTFAAWQPGATPTLQGGSVTTPQERLLKTDCVGCHSSTNTDTTVTIGSNVIPIVFTMGGYPNSGSTLTTPLAGGNFYYTANGQDSYGHNVFGIANPDGQLSIAPGASSGCANSCHTSLADDTVADFTYSGIYGPPVANIYGCQGCHNKVAHHDSTDPSYRFLGGHGGMAVDYVENNYPGTPYENDDWEQTNGSADHNFYKHQTAHFTLDSIGRFCAGCHGKFHAMGNDPSNPGPDPFSGEDNGGDPNTDDLIVRNSTPVNPWMRHPTNVNIPLGDLGGEYSAMSGVNYNPAIPIAQDPAGNPNQIDAGDQVMCLSCHRAHASDKPDALRFDYATLSAHPAGGGAYTNGCFFCHRTKDDP